MRLEGRIPDNHSFEDLGARTAPNHAARRDNNIFAPIRAWAGADPVGNSLFPWVASAEDNSLIGHSF